MWYMPVVLVLFLIDDRLKATPPQSFFISFFLSHHDSRYDVESKKLAKSLKVMLNLMFTSCSEWIHCRNFELRQCRRSTLPRTNPKHVNASLNVSNGRTEDLESEAMGHPYSISLR